MNRQVTLAARPSGFPKESDFNLATSPMLWPARGQVLVQSIFLSVDPYMRGRMSEAESYAPPLAIGEGMPGLPAYFGLLDVCHPKAGQTVVVSGAAGAVGMLVGQLAKIMGCRVVGVAGSDSKVAFLVDELGFDGAFNYPTTSDYFLD